MCLSPYSITYYFWGSSPSPIIHLFTLSLNLKTYNNAHSVMRSTLPPLKATFLLLHKYPYNLEIDYWKFSTRMQESLTRTTISESIKLIYCTAHILESLTRAHVSKSRSWGALALLRNPSRVRASQKEERSYSFRRLTYMRCRTKKIKYAWRRQTAECAKRSAPIQAHSKYYTVAVISPIAQPCISRRNINVNSLFYLTMIREPLELTWRTIFPLLSR